MSESEDCEEMPAIVIANGSGWTKAGFTGDEGPATSASLNYPQGVAVDSSDNVYIADGNNND